VSRPPHATTREIAHAASKAQIRVGFVPLVDAAPLIAACELGFFADEGVRVALERQLGWANVRDKLTYGHLHASHALLGIPIASALRVDWYGEAVVSVMSLGTGGDAITLSRRLVESGVKSAATLARRVHDPHLDRPLLLGHVFGCSMHHYLLREWLASAEVNPDADLRLCVVPPPQMAEQMSQGHLDGFCVGEPWNTMAELSGCGSIVTATTDIVPAHPEKVLAVGRQWAQHNAGAIRAMVRALLRACAYCDDAANAAILVEMLADPRYVGAPREVLAASLRLDRTIAVGPRYAAIRPSDWQMRSFSPRATFPSATHAAWFVEQMVRWGHAPCDTDSAAIAALCTDTRFYREVAAEIGGECPLDDFPPMPLRNGRRFEVNRESSSAIALV
jgi:ABC-type nitrate/sulfonate/bicarbonate transport system substrate-binding protein